MMSEMRQSPTFTSAEDVAERVFGIPTSDERHREAVAGYVAGILDARDAEIERLRAQLAAAGVAGHIKWEYEDQLGDDVELTDGMYRASAVNFVRLYPYIEFQGQRWYLEASRAALEGSD